MAKDDPFEDPFFGDPPKMLKVWLERLEEVRANLEFFRHEETMTETQDLIRLGECLGTMDTFIKWWEAATQLKGDDDKWPTGPEKG